MALRARDAKHVITREPWCDAIGGRSEIGAVALQASAGNQAVEFHLAVPVAGAVDPGIDARQVRHRQLQQRAVLPVQIRLSHAARPHHQLHSLRSRAATGAAEAGLVEHPAHMFHPEPGVGPRRTQLATAGCEMPLDSGGVSLGGGPEVRGLHVGVDNFLMAAAARGRSGFSFLRSGGDDAGGLGITGDMLSTGGCRRHEQADQEPTMGHASAETRHRGSHAAQSAIFPGSTT